MDEERVRPGHWLGSVMYCSFFSDGKGMQPIKSCAIYPQRFGSRTNGERKWRFVWKMAVRTEVLGSLHFMLAEMYIGHGHLCVCLSIPRHIPTLLHGPGCNLGEW